MSSQRRGAKPFDMSSWRHLFADGKFWSGIGVVRARSGENSHFTKDDGDYLVDVDLSPEGAPVHCRLGGSAGGKAIGLWRIPPPDTEVGVLVPNGDVQADPIIVCVLSSGGTPDELDGDTLILTNGDGLVKIGGGAQFAALANKVNDNFSAFWNLLNTLFGSASAVIATTAPSAPDGVYVAMKAAIAAMSIPIPPATDPQFPPADVSAANVKIK